MKSAGQTLNPTTALNLMPCIASAASFNSVTQCMQSQAAMFNAASSYACSPMNASRLCSIIHQPNAGESIKTQGLMHISNDPLFAFGVLAYQGSNDSNNNAISALQWTWSHKLELTGALFCIGALVVLCSSRLRWAIRDRIADIVTSREMNRDRRATSTQMVGSPKKTITTVEVSWNVLEFKHGDMVPNSVRHPTSFTPIVMEGDQRIDRLLAEVSRLSDKLRKKGKCSRDIAEQIAHLVQRHCAKARGKGVFQSSTIILQIALQQAGVRSRFIQGNLNSDRGAANHAWVEVDEADNKYYSYVIDLESNVMGNIINKIARAADDTGRIRIHYVVNDSVYSLDPGLFNIVWRKLEVASSLIPLSWADHVTPEKIAESALSMRSNKSAPYSTTGIQLQYGRIAEPDKPTDEDIIKMNERAKELVLGVIKRRDPVRLSHQMAIRGTVKLTDGVPSDEAPSDDAPTNKFLGGLTIPLSHLVGRVTLPFIRKGKRDK